MIAIDRRQTANQALRRAITVVRRALPFAPPAALRAPPPPPLPTPLPFDRVFEADQIGAALLETQPASLRARPVEHQRQQRPKWRMPVRHLEAVLRRVPLFSLLGELAVEELCATARWRSFASGAPLFTEGEAARTVYLVTGGGVRLDVRGPSGWRDLADREFLDLVGLCGAAPFGKRQARARAEGALTVLELDAPLLARRLAGCASARHLLGATAHDRTVERLLALTPFADALGPWARQKLVSRFDAVFADRGERLVAPGEVRNGLWMVLKGKVGLLEKTPGGHAALATVPAGSYFGSVSGLRGKPIDAMAVALEPSELVALNHGRLHKVFAEHPTARGLPAILASEGRLLGGHFYAGECVVR